MSSRRMARLNQNTNLDGANSQFPATKISAIVASSSDDSIVRSQALEVLVKSYWRPIYKTIRIKWGKSSEDAKDLTQGFFFAAMEKDFFKKFDPRRARFRTFLRTCLNGYLSNEEKWTQRIKRGGAHQILSLDFTDAENELTLASEWREQSPEDFFDSEWTRGFFAQAVAELKDLLESRKKATHFKIFERYDLHQDSPARETYNELSEEFQLPVTQVTNYLAAARREFRAILLANLRDVSVNEEEFRNEARSLFGIDVSGK